MKIIVVFHDNDLYSGATMSSLTNVLYLKGKGHDILAVIPHKDGELDKYLQNNGIKVIKALYGANIYTSKARGVKGIIAYVECLIKTFCSYCSAIVLSKKIKKYKFSKIYSCTSVIYLGYWLSKKLKLEHIWHFREFCLEDQNSLRIFDSNFSKKANNAKYVITISKALDKYYKSKYNVKNTVMLYDDLSSQYIKYKTPKLIIKEVNILVSGTLSEGKGQLVAIKAMELLNDINIHMYLAGKNTEYGDMLQQYVREKDIKNIHFCGLVKDMTSLREKMDISIVCSRSEAFGRTIIEDMLSGIVVIGSDRGAVSELIQNEITGLKYEYGNETQLAYVIRNIVNNTDRFVKIQENAYQYAKKFTDLNTAKRIAELLEEDF